MLGFGKRDNAGGQDANPIGDIPVTVHQEKENSSKETTMSNTQHFDTTPEADNRGNTGGGRPLAVIGPSIQLNGDLQGEEDLRVDGEFTGTIKLKNNALTVGSQGKVKANVYAKTICVEGYMEGDMYGSERVIIRRSAQVLGNITSPRVSLEDGAKLKGSVEMDPEALQSVFTGKDANRTAPKPSAVPPAEARPAESKPAESKPVTIQPAETGDGAGKSVSSAG